MFLPQWRASAERASRLGLLPLLPVLFGHCQAVIMGGGAVIVLTTPHARQKIARAPFYKTLLDTAIFVMLHYHVI